MDNVAGSKAHAKEPQGRSNRSRKTSEAAEPDEVFEERAAKLPQAIRELDLGEDKPVPLNANDSTFKITGDEIVKIANSLQRTGRKEWSERPRTYAILRLIGAIDLMDKFVRQNCLDMALPYTKSNLPDCLSPGLPIVYGVWPY